MLACAGPPGDPYVVTFPRSALKPLQLLALVELGGIERFSLESEDLAVMAGSHGGEQIHINQLFNILDRIGAPVEALTCGAQQPLDPTAADNLRSVGIPPTQLHNNCSGKHAGMLALAILLGVSIEGYAAPNHPAQRVIEECVADLLELDPQRLVVGVDGCGAPAFALPLNRMARGYSLLGNPSLAPERHRNALEAIAHAMRRHPELIAGTTGRIDSELMRLSPRLIAKSGAEGYFCVGEAGGTGLALKLIDGDASGRAINVAALMSVYHAGWISEKDLAGSLAVFGPRVPLLGVAGQRTGEVRPSELLAGRHHQ